MNTERQDNSAELSANVSLTSAGQEDGASLVLPEEEQLRAEFYDFLSGVLARPPSAELLRGIADLRPGDGVIGAAITSLQRIAARVDEKSASHEFHDLFIGLGRGELMPFASYYMTGFLNEKPLAKLRQDMQRLRIERAPNVYEPEDNIASLMEMMAGLIRGRFAGPVPLGVQRDFFNTHLAPWARHFFTDLEGAKNSVLYAPIGALGRSLIEIESEAFRMEANPS